MQASNPAQNSQFRLTQRHSSRLGHKPHANFFRRAASNPRTRKSPRSTCESHGHPKPTNREPHVDQMLTNVDLQPCAIPAHVATISEKKPTGCLQHSVKTPRMLTNVNT